MGKGKLCGCTFFFLVFLLRKLCKLQIIRTKSVFLASPLTELHRPPTHSPTLSFSFPLLSLSLLVLPFASSTMIIVLLTSLTTPCRVGLTNLAPTPTLCASDSSSSGARTTTLCNRIGTHAIKHWGPENVQIIYNRSRFKFYLDMCVFCVSLFYLFVVIQWLRKRRTISEFECQMNTRTQAQQPLRTYTHAHWHTLAYNYTYADHRIRRYFRRLATRSDGVSNGEWAAAVVKLAVLYDIWKEKRARVFPSPPAAAHENRKALRQGRELFTFLSRLLLLPLPSPPHHPHSLFSRIVQLFRRRGVVEPWVKFLMSIFG